VGGDNVDGSKFQGIEKEDFAGVLKGCGLRGGM
jgi:hypothetical protein